MNKLKVIYEVLIRYGPNGEFQGAHVQFREVFVDDNGAMITERLLPPVPFGADPDFPPSVLLGKITSDALATAELHAAAASYAEQARDAAAAAAQQALDEAAAAAQQALDKAVAARDAAIAERDAAIAERDAAIAGRDAALAEKAFAAACADEVIAELQARINELTAVPERPEGKWWVNAAAFLEEFTPEETHAISRSDVPLISKLLMMLLAWPGEIWAADERIQDGLQALVATEVLTEARRQAILT